jgi:hypothetical protein
MAVTESRFSSHGKVTKLIMLNPRFIASNVKPENPLTDENENQRTRRPRQRATNEPRFVPTAAADRQG